LTGIDRLRDCGTKDDDDDDNNHNDDVDHHNDNTEVELISPVLSNILPNSLFFCLQFITT